MMLTLSVPKCLFVNFCLLLSMIMYWTWLGKLDRILLNRLPSIHQHGAFVSNVVILRNFLAIPPLKCDSKLWLHNPSDSFGLLAYDTCVSKEAFGNFFEMGGAEFLTIDLMHTCFRRFFSWGHYRAVIWPQPPAFSSRGSTSSLRLHGMQL